MKKLLLITLLFCYTSFCLSQMDLDPKQIQITCKDLNENFLCKGYFKELWQIYKPKDTNESLTFNDYLDNTSTHSTEFFLFLDHLMEKNKASYSLYVGKPNSIYQWFREIIMPAFYAKNNIVIPANGQHCEL